MVYTAMASKVVATTLIPSVKLSTILGPGLWSSIFVEAPTATTTVAGLMKCIGFVI